MLAFSACQVQLTSGIGSCVVARPVTVRSQPRAGCARSAAMTTPLTVTNVTNVIDGKAVNGSSGEIRQIFNPSTGEVLTQLNESTVEDGDRAVSAARAAFPAWAARTPGARSELLHRLVEVIERTSTISPAWRPSTRVSRPLWPVVTNCPGSLPPYVTSPAPPARWPVRQLGSSSRTTPVTCAANPWASSWASRRGTFLCGKRFGSSGRRWLRATRW